MSESRAMSTFRAVRAVLLACLLPATLPPAARAAEWKAGVARAVITPATPMWMSGYASRDRPAEGKLHDLWAEALVLEAADGRRVALVTLDLCGIDRAMSRRITQRLAERCGLPREAVALNVSHTHSGPVVGNNLRAMYSLDAAQQKRVDEYTAGLEQTVEQLVGDALAGLAPARLEWGIGTASFAVNRRANPEAEVPRRRAEGKLQGPVDHDLPVLAVRDADGGLKAVIFGYACHATTTNLYEWSGDWPAFARTELERAHPGAVALFWAGCGADQNPLPRRTVELARDYGRQAAAGVEAVLAAGMKPVAPRVAATYAEIGLPFAALPTAEQLKAEAASGDRYAAGRAKLLLDRLGKEGKLSPAYPYPVQAWRLGDDVRWIFLGGEAVVDFSLRLKRELAGGPATFVAAYANDVMAYIPSRRVLAEGGYEGGDAMVYYGLPSQWAPEVEDLIVAEVRRQAGASK